MFRDPVQLDLGRIRARGVQECAAGASGLVDGLLVQYLIVVTVIRILLADHIHQSRPAAPHADVGRTHQVITLMLQLIGMLQAREEVPSTPAVQVVN